MEEVFARVSALEAALQQQAKRTQQAEGALESEQQQHSNQLLVLLYKLHGRRQSARDKSADDGHGAEAWRKLADEYEPSAENSLVETTPSRRPWHGARSLKYEGQSGDSAADNIKHGVLAGGMWNAKVRNHLNLNMAKLVSFEQLRNEVISYASAMGICTDASEPMDVGALSKGKARKEAKAKAVRIPKGKGKDAKTGEQRTNKKTPKVILATTAAKLITTKASVANSKQISLVGWWTNKEKQRVVAKAPHRTQSCATQIMVFVLCACQSTRHTAQACHGGTARASDHGRLQVQ
eukprot:4455884-Amphidinium_carterae.2